MLSRLVVPWSGTAPWRPNRRVYKRAIRDDADAKAAVHNSRLQWEPTVQMIDNEDLSLSWKDLRSAPGLSAADADLWHRILIGRAAIWYPTTGTTTCRHAECGPSTASGTSHTSWHCKMAARVWSTTATIWGARDLAALDLASSVFAWQAPETGINWAAIVRDRPNRPAIFDSDRLHYWLEFAWRQLVNCGVRKIRQTRLSEVHDGDGTDVAGIPFAIRHAWRIKLFGTLEAISARATETRDVDLFIQRVILVTFTSSIADVPHHPKHGSVAYVLFFDGGSRGNPGPGGSGSVIVRHEGTASTATLLWVASMSYRHRSTTNNAAEYRGLCTGLQAAARHRWTPLAVVGDSQLIIRQMKLRRPPRAAPLKAAYTYARTQSDSLQVVGWHHHYREYNKMADKAANIAMDAGTSQQTLRSDDRPIIAAIEALLANDIAQWFSPLPVHDTA